MYFVCVCECAIDCVVCVYLYVGGRTDTSVSGVGVYMSASHEYKYALSPLTH